jgi:hypothetical protein
VDSFVDALVAMNVLFDFWVMRVVLWVGHTVPPLRYVSAIYHSILGNTCSAEVRPLSV